MALLWFVSKKRIEERARREAASVVKKDAPRYLHEEVDVGGLIYLHLSKNIRYSIEKLQDRSIAAGIRQALLAKMFRIKYVPGNTVAYSYTRNAIIDTFGTDIATPEDLAKIMNRVQKWEADNLIAYEALPSGPLKLSGELIKFTPIETEEESRVEKLYNNLIYDLSGIRESGIRGFIQGSMLVDKIGKGDTVFLISTLQILKDSLDLKPAGFDTVYVYNRRKKRIVRSSTKSRDYPLYDGFIKTRFLDPGLKEFDNRVEEYLEKLGGEKQELKNIAWEIWRNARNTIHAFAPTWYQAFGFDAETYLPKHVAETIYELAELYKKTMNIRKNPFKYAKEDVEKILNVLSEVYKTDKNDRLLKREVAKLFTKLAPERIDKFTQSRIPYLFARVGEKIGWGFSLSKVFTYLASDSDTAAISKTLLKYGVVLSPKEVKDVLETSHFDHNLITRIIYKKEFIGLNAGYVFFYSMGIPVTRVFLHNARVVTIMNLKYMLEKPEILDTKIQVKIPYTGIEIDTTIGREVFKAFDKAIRNYLKIAYNSYSSRGRKISPSDPRLYQSILYLFSDIDFTGKRQTSTSIHSMLLGSIESIVTNMLYLKYRAEEVRKDIEKFAKKIEKKYKLVYGEINLQNVKLPKKLSEFVGELSTVMLAVNNLGESIVSSAQIVSPKYIGILSKRSENIYRSFYEIYETTGLVPEAVGKTAKEAPEPTTPTKIPEISMSPIDLMPKLSNIIPLIELANKPREFQKEWQKRKEKRRRGLTEEELTRLPLIFKPIEAPEKEKTETPTPPTRLEEEQEKETEEQKTPEKEKKKITILPEKEQEKETITTTKEEETPQETTETGEEGEESIQTERKK